MTIRIDTARNQIAATVELLTNAGVELEDLHVLAYDRPTAAEDRAHVTGGSYDYALDNHGDPRARDAYRTLVAAVDTACIDLAAAAHEVLRRLRVDGPARRLRGPRHVTALEIAALIVAQGERIRRGEYTPIRRLPQPTRDQALAAAEQRRADAEAKAAELQHELDVARRDLENLRARPPFGTEHHRQ